MGLTPDVVDVSGGNLVLVVVVAVVALLALGMAAMFRQEVSAAGEGTDRMKEIALRSKKVPTPSCTRQFRPSASSPGRVPRAPGPARRDLGIPSDGPCSSWSAPASRRDRLPRHVPGGARHLRVAAAAETVGRDPAMTVGFRTGAFVGMADRGPGPARRQPRRAHLQGRGPVGPGRLRLRAALLAMFMRVGGGIFTKAADVGADLVGKVEHGIPEDDPRNAATIADNVGDNVGDCAGMAADLFESYAVRWWRR